MRFPGRPQFADPSFLFATALSLLATVVLAACDASGPLGPAPGGPAPRVEAVVVTPAEAMIDVGSTITFEAEVFGSGGVSQTVHWSSSDQAVATVNPLGEATGVAAGEVTITATSDQDPSVSGVAALEIVAP